MQIQLGLHWACNDGDRHDIPIDLFRLLQAIVDAGTLRAAADDCAMSYRHAWGMLQAWQGHFSQVLVDLKRGRGQKAQLTVFGEKLLWEYQRISARVEPELASLASELSAELMALEQSESAHNLRIAASHGLVISSLRDLAQQQNKALQLDIQFQGSLDSLRQYKAGNYDIAGFHLPEGSLGNAVLPQVKRFLNPEKDVLIYALRRQQGLMMPVDNPNNIQGLTDLIRPEIKFINRQRNSGSRITLDEMLRKENIDSHLINGYENEEFTHSAVAALIASGAADCGFGLEAAAAQFNLDFIPLNWEAYWFVLPKVKLNGSAVKHFIQLLQGDLFSQRAATLKGYETSRSGSVIMPDLDLSVLLF